MGRALTTDECLRQAQDCLVLAEGTPEPGLRDQYLKLAKNLQELAAILLARESKVVEIGDAPGANNGAEKRSSGSGLTR